MLLTCTRPSFPLGNGMMYRRFMRVSIDSSLRPRTMGLGTLKPMPYFAVYLMERMPWFACGVGGEGVEGRQSVNREAPPRIRVNGK